MQFGEHNKDKSEQKRERRLKFLTYGAGGALGTVLACTLLGISPQDVKNTLSQEETRASGQSSFQINTPSQERRPQANPIQEPSASQAPASSSSSAQQTTTTQAPEQQAEQPTGPSYTADATAYYPDNSPQEGGFVDRKGKPLQTLQDFVEGRASYVSVAMDIPAFPYNTQLKIPELEAKYGMPIDFRVVDTGGAFRGKGTTRIDICVRDRQSSYEATVNGNVTLIPVS